LGCSSMISPDEFRLLSDYIEKYCGIHLTGDKEYLVETRLTPLMVEQGCRSFGELYQKAVTESTQTLRNKIIEAITTNETFWFRDLSPFRILNDLLFQQYAVEIESGKRSKIKIWCTACSTGQEPYSIAMTFLEVARQHAFLRSEHIEILATDISSIVLYLAKAGRYDNLAISRGLADGFRSRYFEKDDKVWRLKDDVKKMVTLKKLNLQDDFHHLGRQDIIFCRNILIYFSIDFKQDILRRIARLLRPSGYLFLGASESIIMYTDEYNMMKHAMGLYYQVKQGVG